MRKLKCSELVLDFDMYPRHDVDSQHVGQIAQAIAAGAELPPIIVCRKSKRVVDGFHRVRANVRLYGEDAQVPVVEKTYKNDRELFLDAMRYNASHGRALSTFDRAHCAIKAVNLGIDDTLIAGVLHVDPDYVCSLRVERSAKAEGLTVPIKRTISHMAGKRLNKAQVAANDKLSGMNQLFYVNQIITLVESGLLDKENDDLMARLQALATLLEDLLTAK